MLAGTGILSPQLGFNWNGGTISGAGVAINVANAMSINSGDHQFDAGAILTLGSATATWNSGFIRSAGGGNVSFDNFGTFVDNADEPWLRDSATVPVFNNAGLYSKAAGTGDTQKAVQAVFNNSGVVDALVNLWFAGGGESTGVFSVGLDARLSFSDFSQAHPGSPITTLAASSIIESVSTVAFAHDLAGSVTSVHGTYNSAHTIIDAGPGGIVTFEPGAQVNGSTYGDLQVISGTVAYQTGSGPILFGDGQLSSGTISGSDDLQFESFYWSGGTISGDSTAELTTGSMTITGAQPKTLSNRRLTNLGPMAIQAGATLTYESGELAAGDLRLTGGGDLIFTPGGDKTLQASSLVIDAANGSRIDLADNRAIVQYTGASPIESMSELIEQAYNGGLWTGDGITSSLADPVNHGVGYSEASAVDATTFGGFEVEDAVLIAYTFYGDANLDGLVDISDLARLANNWLAAGDWSDGDFDYNGIVDAADLGLLGTNWDALADSSFEEALTSLALPTSAVPEPAVAYALVLAAIAALTARRR
jgi:hypothetical protein